VIETDWTVVVGAEKEMDEQDEARIPAMVKVVEVASEAVQVAEP